MPVQIEVNYLNDLMCEVIHTPSGNKFFTDAPLDNNGNARYISPTDLLAGSIASCVATIMGIKANNNGIDLSGLKIIASKEMVNEPFRRVGKIELDIRFARAYSEIEFKILENVVKTCPVTRSLLSEIEISYKFTFGE